MDAAASAPECRAPEDHVRLIINLATVTPLARALVARHGSRPTATSLHLKLV